MIKKVVLLLLAVVSVYAAVLSPFSIMQTLEEKTQLETALQAQSQAKQSRDAAKSSSASAKSAFDSERVFTTGYTEVVELRSLIDRVTGITFVELREADINSNYAPGVVIDLDSFTSSGDDGVPTATLPPALILSLMAENTAAGLKIVNMLELPICRITTQEPGRIDIVFLTGGES